MTSIGTSSTFYNCTALERVSLPEITSVGASCFYGCTSLSTISLPKVTSFGNNAFKNCTSLTEVTGTLFPLLTSIGQNCFENCTAIENVSLQSLASIGNAAFKGCTSLTSVSLPAASSIGTNSFQGDIALVNISLPSATSASSFAFHNCSSLKNASFPIATSVGGSCFMNCSNLESISLPLVTSIGTYAFDGCTSLKTLSLPLVESIGVYAFNNCGSLTAVILGNTEQVVTIASNTIWERSPNIIFYVPDALVDDYKAANYWSNISSRIKGISELCTATFVLSTADSTTGSQYTLQTVQVRKGSTPAYTGATPTTVQGDATEFTFTGWSPALAPIYANTTYVAQFQDNRAVTIQYLSRNIAEYESSSNTTFVAYGLGYATKLTSATAPATSVEGYAFANDTNLEVVDLSATSGAVTIANNAFNGCTNLQHVIIRSSTMATLSSTGAFTGTPIELGEGAVYVPTSLVATYKANTNWSNYYIADIADYPLSDLSTVTDSWSTIISNANYATDYSVGDVKLVDFGTFGQHYFELVALDEDTKASGGKARMTWLNKNFLTMHVMNTTSTTTGGYDATEMKSWITSDVLPQLQSEIRNAIVPVTKISSTYENKAVVVNGQSTTESLWIPSEYEMFGTTTYENTGARYSKFNSNASRIKYNSSGSASDWWLRSAVSTGNFRCVYSNGSAVSGSGASSTAGVVLGFCI